MAENIDELTIQYEEDDEVLVKELEKEVLTRVAWATIMYKYQDKDRANDTWKEPKATIRRYKKAGGNFMVKSKFNISNAKQAKQIAKVLQDWFKEEEA